MPQETNLNVSPYFDDFDPKNNYYKTLFKPGFPVQARELTGLQSTLQNQIERFGGHLFKEGSSVTGGGVKYNNAFPTVRINTSYSGVSVNRYLSKLLDKTLIGETSGVKAQIKAYLNKASLPGQPYTLFVNYLDASAATDEGGTFIPGENLILEGQISTSNVIIQSGEGCATVSTIDNAISIGSGAVLTGGVYFVRGYFIDVPEQSIILEPFSTRPSYKIGLEVYEEIISSDIDPKLADNASGFNNYNAPGADRLKIRVYLTKKSTDNVGAISNFIELMEVREGVIVSSEKDLQYNELAKEFARRTADESGDYYVTPFTITPKDTLNDFKGNKGIFSEDQLTYNNQTPSDDLGTYKLSPGKAYVKGYEVETITPSFIDFKKPRTTKLLENQSLNYVTGPTFALNRVSGSPNLGISTTYTLSLRDQRIGSSGIAAAGKEIGIARVYDFALESGSYDAVNSNTNQWDIALYDVQSYTDITVNTNVTLTTPTHIKGKSSGAKGFLRYNVSAGTALTAYNVQGRFIPGEQFIFNGIESGNIANTITNYSSSDAKSLYGIVGTAYTFNADVKQSVLSNIGQVNISAASGGVSTVTSTDPARFFTGITTVGNIVSYGNTGINEETFSRITSVSQRSLVITGMTTVTGVCDGALPGNLINPSNFKILTSNFQSSTDNTLYTELPKDHVATVDLSDSYLTVKKQYDVSISSSSTGSISSGDTDLTFLPYDEELYTLIRKDGTTENLSSDKFAYGSGGSTITISGLASGSGPAKLIATLRKIKVESKIKDIKKINTLTISNSKYSQSGVGATTLNDGLSYSAVYGTRVQDEDISLNVSDATKIYGIFESRNAAAPSLPSITLSSINGPTAKTQDLLVGEEFIGKKSNAIGVYVSRVNDSKINYISLNDNEFESDEVITFKESNISALFTSKTVGSNNIVKNFTFDNGQKDTIYDYSKLVRHSNVKEPTKQLTVVFESAYFDSSDTGDITTVNSYDAFNYCSLPEINETSVSNIIDIRPRVSDFSGTSYSPFEFLGRNFTADGNSAANILASDQSILLDYSFYLPRIDRIFLSKNGNFQLLNGIPSETPELPVRIDDAIEIAKVVLPAYLCDVNDVSITLTDHKRYQMKDIHKLETRIKNLEFYTSLSVLESDTANLEIRDVDGLNRFKSGFFVDDFSTTDTQLKKTINKNSIDIKNGELRPAAFATELDLQVENISNGIRKTGRTLTLDYDESVLINQPYATRTENVTPYLVNYYSGTIELNPCSDCWVEQIQLAAQRVEVENYTSTLVQTADGDFHCGMDNVIWDAWSTVWTGNDVNETYVDEWVINTELNRREKRRTTTTTSTRTGSRTRQGYYDHIREIITDTNQGNVVLAKEIIPYMRSRNIAFTARRMKPGTRLYGFFDGEDVNKYMIPKLLEITMKSGVFSVGETIVGKTLDGTELIRFRSTVANHRSGPIDNPNTFYYRNPYNRAENIPSLYSSTTEILNVDTDSLAAKAVGDYHGYIRSGIQLVGQTSNAQAEINNIRLVSDQTGSVIGSFYIPKPNVAENPKFETGMKMFRLTSSNVNSQLPGNILTDASQSYETAGVLSKNRENILSCRNVTHEKQVQTETEAITGQSTVTVNTTVLDSQPLPTPEPPPTPIPVAPTPVPIAPVPVEPTPVPITPVPVYSPPVEPTPDPPQPIPVALPPTAPPIAPPFSPPVPIAPVPVPTTATQVYMTISQHDVEGGVDYTDLNDGTASEENQVLAFVQGLYKDELGIIPDAEGEAWWTKQATDILDAGGSLDQAQEETKASFMSDINVVTFGASYNDGVALLATIDNSTNTDGGYTGSEVAGDNALVQTVDGSGTIITNTATDTRFDTGTSTKAESTQDELWAAQLTTAYKVFAPASQIEGDKLDTQVQGWIDYLNSGDKGGIEAAMATVKNHSWNTDADKDMQNAPACNAGETDPLAQSFFVNEPNGIFITRIEVFFSSKDDHLPCIVQLRPMQLGLPTNEVYPYSEITLEPDQIQTSIDASVPTTVIFDAPVYLAGGQYHSVVLLSQSNNYRAWISRMGETDIQTVNSPIDEQIVVSQQPLLGSLFKSQNGVTWNASQYEDLKFKLYRANFKSFTGTVNFTNPPLTTVSEFIKPLPKDSLELSSNKVRVGLTTVLNDTALTLGNTIRQQGTNATGNYVGSAGTATGALTLTNAGIGYTPASGSTTFSNVSLTSLTGSGRDGKANITINNGVAVAATVSQGGYGYVIGDVLTASTVGVTSLGTNLRLSVAGLSGTNELIIDNVQGIFETGAGKYLKYDNNVGVTTTLNGEFSGNVLLSSAPTSVSDGLHIKVNHLNHGMYSTQNSVSINGVQSDIPSTLLTTEYDASAVGSFSIEDASEFTTFENVGVGTTNIGYAMVGDELISYTGVSGNSLTGITTRGIDGTIPQLHPINSSVRKYQLSGVSLRRINKDHNLADATVTDPIGLDYYNVKIDMSENGLDRSAGVSTYPQLHFNESGSIGGSIIKSTENIPFEIVRPIVENITPVGTNVNAQIRTVTGSSVGGSETPFVEKPFETISLTTNNYLNSPRMIASRLNETTSLPNIVNNRSFTMNLELFTGELSLSPMVDLDRVAVILASNRVNNPITNYVTDNRVSTLIDDPNAFVYASVPVSLENPATAIKIYMTGHINLFNDIRAFYAISNDPNEEFVYNPFPGHTNLLESGQVINPANNNGLPDKLVPKTDKLAYISREVVYKDYEYTIDNLPNFRYFGIKLIGTSTNKANPPRIKDLRVIALA